MYLYKMQALIVYTELMDMNMHDLPFTSSSSECTRIVLS